MHTLARAAIQFIGKVARRLRERDQLQVAEQVRPLAAVSGNFGTGVRLGTFA
jgi:hypothetical protein